MAYDEVVDLFAADGEVRFMGGAFIGKPGLRRLFEKGWAHTPA